MGRGDNNLLFNPSRLVRRAEAKEVLEAIRRGDFFGTAWSIHSGGEEERSSFSLQEVGHSFYLQEGPEEEDDLSGAVLLDQDQFPSTLDGTENVALNSEGLLFFDGQDLCLYATIKPGFEFYCYPFAGEGEILGLHAGREKLFLLWHEDDGGIILSHYRRSFDRVIDTENLLETDASYAIMENHGDKSILLATTHDMNVPGEIDFLLTIGKDGMGEPQYLDQYVSMSLRALDGTGKRFLAPGKADGTYFFLNPRDGGRDGALCFLEQDGTARALDGGFQDGGVRALASSGDNCLLLARDKLYLYDKEGLIKEIALGDGKDYDSLSFVGSKAIIWKRGGKQFQEIIINEESIAR